MATEPFDPAVWVMQWRNAGGEIMRDELGGVLVSSEVERSTQLHDLWEDIAGDHARRAAVRAVICDVDVAS